MGAARRCHASNADHRRWEAHAHVAQEDAGSQARTGRRRDRRGRGTGGRVIATAPPAAASAATAAARPTAASATKARPAAASDSCAHPTFAHGQAQNVFSSNPSTWVRGEAWVQTTDDSDHDGVPDRIHVDITRPAETANPACGYKAPVILEESPYYAGLGPEFTWPVDYELGNPPPPRVPEPNWTARNTSPIISTIYESTWLPRGFAVVHAEAPGTGYSTGCPTGGGPNETEAGKAVVQWLNGKAPAFTSPTSDQRVSADWTDGNVGMTGTSYNGTLAEAVATTGVQGLKAIVPVSGISDWYDYYRANGMVRAPFTFQGEDLDVLADVVYSRADRSICRSEIDGLVNEEDRVTGDFNQYWGGARLHAGRASRARGGADGAREQRLQRHDQEHGPVLRGDQGAGCPAHALLPPGWPPRPARPSPPVRRPVTPWPAWPGRSPPTPGTAACQPARPQRWTSPSPRSRPSSAADAAARPHLDSRPVAGVPATGRGSLLVGFLPWRQAVTGWLPSRLS
jgi:X-Pro dipeptidyl-peptidase (S15 family)